MLGVNDAVSRDAVYDDPSWRRGLVSRVVNAEEVASLDGQGLRHVDAVDTDGGRPQSDAVLQYVLVRLQVTPDAGKRRAGRWSAEVDDLTECRVTGDLIVEHQTGAPAVSEAR